MSPEEARERFATAPPAGPVLEVTVPRWSECAA
jgi:hypothetical protein